MSSTKSLQYEVLVYPPTEQSDAMTSFNSVHQRLQTQLRRFSYDRENMQQYWIPDGFRPVLVHRNQLRTSLAVNDHNDYQFNVSATTSDTTLRPKRHLISSSSKPNRTSSVTFNATALYYKLKCKELMDKGIIKSPPIYPPSKIIGKMWNEEPEHAKRYYERLAHKIKKHRLAHFKRRDVACSSTRADHIQHQQLTAPITNDLIVLSKNTVPQSSSEDRHVLEIIRQKSSTEFFANTLRMS
ncbi:1377_t:CDS:1 [Acaulospora morrowiae]|uniref:1377_t:CDS:1 n=1 Tax=Acaulospora morrowiae TaxID=94023 RepID=A0A9N8ZWH8_9GLOM|nr:1377_t:CDS:1 [Acaulospora morrowiae]